MKPINKREKH